MKQQQHMVTMRVPTNELCELYAWVAALKESELLSTVLVKEELSGEATVTPVKAAKAKRWPKPTRDKVAAELDPRIVRDKNGRIAIDQSLKELGLDEGYLFRNATKSGTAEHIVKMAISQRHRRRRQPRSAADHRPNGILAV